jgi:hypothetical protein
MNIHTVPNEEVFTELVKFIGGRKNMPFAFLSLSLSLSLSTLGPRIH